MSAGGPPPQPQAPPEPRLHVEFAHSQNSAADWTDEITQFAPAASTAVNIGAVIAFLAAAFLVFEIASGRTKVPTEAGNFSSAAAVFCLSALVTGAGLIVSQWRTRATGFMLAVFGMVLLAGVPSFLPKTVQSSAALFQGSGFFIFILGLAKIGIDVAFGVSPKSTTTHAAGTYQAASPAPPPGMHRAPVAPQQHASPIQGQHAPPAPGASHVPHPSVPQPKVPVEEEIIDDGNQFSTLRHTMESMEPVALWVFRIAAAVGGLALGYLLYAIFAGHIGQADATISSGTVSMVKLAATVLQWSLILLALSGLWLAMDMPYLGLMLIGVGMATYFGAPWALGTVGKTQILADVATSLRSCGFGLSIVGIIKQLYETVLWAMNLPNRMKQKADVGTAKMAEPAQRKVAREATMTSPCWKLPFCREAIRKQCPAFLAKKTCWKFGRGCYCDEEMISRIIRGESTDVVKAPTRLSRKGKPPCGRCHIYMEHQGYKFKMLSPLAIPGSALLMYAIWPHYSALLAWVLTRPFWDAINFGSIKAKAPLAPNDPSNVPVSSLSDDQIAYFATIFLGILLGFFIFVQVSKFIEWAIYKAKL